MIANTIRIRSANCHASVAADFHRMFGVLDETTELHFREQ